MGWDPQGEEWSKPQHSISTDKTWWRKFEGGSGVYVRRGGEFPRGFGDSVETPLRACPCGGERRARPGSLSAGGQELSNAGGTWEPRCGIWDAAE